MKSIYIDLLIDKRNIIILHRVFLFEYRIGIYSLYYFNNIITWSEIRSEFISNASFAKQEKGGLH